MVSAVSLVERFKRGVVPIARHLAFDAARYRILGGHEPEMTALERLSPARATAIDIGANSGAYTYAMSKLFSNVWSFEANEIIARPIAAANLPNVRLETVALSSSSGRAVLKVPVVNGQQLTGWATLEKNPLSDNSVDIEVRTATLDSYAISDVSFIKMDVEGHEPAVLAGAARTIKTWRPVCLIEANAGADDRIDAYFKPLGYALKREWNGVHLSAQNVLVVPEELHGAVAV